jgi:hypothetical protein
MSGILAANVNRDDENKLLYDLLKAFDSVEQRFNDLRPLLERVAVISSKVNDSEHEIDRLRDKVDKLSHDIAGIIVQIKEAKKVNSGGITPSWVAVVLSIIGLILTVLFKLIEWIKTQ